MGRQNPHQELHAPRQLLCVRLLWLSGGDVSWWVMCLQLAGTLDMAKAPSKFRMLKKVLTPAPTGLLYNQAMLERGRW